MFLQSVLGRMSLKNISARKKAVLATFGVFLLVGLGFFGWQIQHGRLSSRADTINTNYNFADVGPDHWAYLPVQAVARSGIMYGFSQSTGNNFKPDLSMTREQGAAYLARAFSGSDASIPPIVANPSFEEGSGVVVGSGATKWTLMPYHWRTADTKIDGAYSLYFNNRGVSVNSASISSPIDVAPNTQYTLSGWVKINSGYVGNAYLDLNDMYGECNALAKITITNQWQRVSCSFKTTSRDNVYIRVVHDKDSKGSAYWDAIQLRQVKPTSFSTNFIKDSSFESADFTDSWSVFDKNMTASSVSYSSPYKGSQVAKLKVTTTSTIRQPFAYAGNINDKYTVSMYVKADSSAVVNLCTWFLGTSNENGCTGAKTVGTGWTRLTASKTTTKAYTTIQPELYVYTPGVYVYADAAQLEPGLTASAYSDLDAKFVNLDTPVCNDVDRASWTYRYINYLINKGIIEECGGPTARKNLNPTGTLNRDQLAVWLAKAMANGTWNLNYNLADNSSFEDGTDMAAANWSGYGLLNRVAENPVDGKYSYKFSGTNVNAGIPNGASIALSQNNNYTLSGWVYVKSGYRGNAYLDLSDIPEDCQPMADITIVDTWQRISCTTPKMGANRTNVNIRIVHDANATGTVYWDAIQLEKGSNLSTYVNMDNPIATDVPTTNWAFKPIQYLLTNNFVSLDSDGTFKPSSALTRAQMADILAKNYDLISTVLVANVAGIVTNSAGQPLANGYLVIDDGEDIIKIGADGKYSETGLDATTYEVSIFDADGNEYQFPNADGSAIPADFNAPGIDIDKEANNAMLRAEKQIMSLGWGTNTKDFKGVVKK